MTDDSRLADTAPQPGEGNLITRIMTSIDSMTEGERRITDYLLKHQSAVYGMSQAKLARACGVSAPTISRYCKRLGEKDYHSFQLALVRAGYLMHDGGSISERDRAISAADVAGSLANLLAAKIGDLTSTIESLPVESLAAAVDAIAAARTMLVAGAGRTLPTALDAAYKFERIGIMCPTSLYYEKLLSSAILLREGDALLLISRSGWTGTLQQVTQAAKDAGATVVLVTANRSCPLARMADHVFLATSTDDMLDGRGGNSRMSEMLIIEALYALVAARRRDSLDYIKRHYSYVMSDVDLP
ncbi:MAG TPA: MurR/RpiR family transcriptional regulator [Candidatus Olsenella pullistercoris]|uniref:MurR/RpiR family transcriptional regulator n=1 Tax=Candidatus Olsenella pullistercoris TaxID=2838712 RepID=A0A9D2EY29_9ACTN|nr:MurR/RpiR family transcriptional regulator [Candidatus Olsenella pullistercoris]